MDTALFTLYYNINRLKSSITEVHIQTKYEYYLIYDSYVKMVGE